jgi:hypothetical protein
MHKLDLKKKMDLNENVELLRRNQLEVREGKGERI